MPIPFKREALRNLMRAAADSVADDERILLAFMDDEEKAKYLALSPEDRYAYRHQPFDPATQAIIDEFEEKLLDGMLNIEPRR